MARQPDKERLQQINRYLEEHPGARPAEVARGLEVPRSSVTRALPSLEEAGYLLTEDRRGRLWPWQRN
jgi:DNA-binding IclR family transcriptional regulator